MLKSLYSGVSGMKGFQTKMDVISDNIANVNTMGFKASRVIFEDLMSQSTSTSSSASNNLGGTNAKQIGLGVKTGSIDKDTSAGSPQATGRALDFYINGGGYFIVQNETGEDLYTRDGAFSRDNQGNLTTSDGLKVMGRAATTPLTEYTDGTDTDAALAASGNLSALTIPSTITVNGETLNYDSVSVDQNGLVIGKYGSQNFVMGKISLATFNNAAGLENVGGNNYAVSANSGAAIISNPGDTGTGTVISGELEMSNVDLSSEFTEMIIANRAYQANAKTITTSDEMLQTLINLKQS
ncbi:flagellar hook-basal body complex protein [Liquorilactobacillus mali]|uniref:Flagellar hook protein FlgE n=1 Tax=Liquorilactobacillus mali KCTC 3596 = DSM 20444 TaxID=1046596 RepID=J1F625_9LACO|nr:flagellar hook-basal body complex protein [Liquorilactobacillus mali]AJA34106.1 flagellar hook protein FlgE [Liquorilactobacillus mali KCTC 3596 = DSM 20444]EJF02203.1 flagellar hook protein FlgE [Liquorilactobacillus mali KCTC 3596 = DSM 20444]KRN11129.1 flagellar hook protein flgE [Liquorilactobacillus mali KCTC 3596 = DSM 20444]MDC7953968.1 flagellar hook-basal body complex protein [Liquorilactobacillus mali]MDV7757463.1 flagellar hook-basal body complex protein [Liquorilactobacillus mal